MTPEFSRFDRGRMPRQAVQLTTASLAPRRLTFEVHSDSEFQRLFDFIQLENSKADWRGLWNAVIGPAAFDPVPLKNMWTERQFVLTESRILRVSGPKVVDSNRSFSLALDNESGAYDARSDYLLIDSPRVPSMFDWLVIERGVGGKSASLTLTLPYSDGFHNHEVDELWDKLYRLSRFLGWYDVNPANLQMAVDSHAHQRGICIKWGKAIIEASPRPRSIVERQNHKPCDFGEALLFGEPEEEHDRKEVAKLSCFCFDFKDAMSLKRIFEECGLPLRAPYGDVIADMLLHNGPLKVIYPVKNVFVNGDGFIRCDLSRKHTVSYGLRGTDTKLNISAYNLEFAAKIEIILRSSRGLEVDEGPVATVRWS